MVVEVCLLLLGEIMSKRQILGVVGLLGAVTIPLNYNIFINFEQVAAENIFADEKVAYDEAVEKVRDLQEVAEKNKSEVYPGLDLYLGELADELDGHYGQLDEESTKEAMAAMNEAVEAVPYLLGLNRKQPVTNKSRAYNTDSSVVALNDKASVSDDEIANATKSEVAQTDVKIEVKKENSVVANSVKEEASNATAKAEVKTEKAADEQVAQAEGKAPEAQKEVESQSEVAELPKTGTVEEKKIGVAGLIVTGVVVVISTIAASVAVLASRKKK